MRSNFFKNLKKDEQASGKITYQKFIIIGGELSSVLLKEYLVGEFGKDSLKIIQTSEMEENDLVPYGLETLRGEANIQVMKALYPQLSFSQVESANKYFKDQKFKEFNPRKQNVKFFPGEEYFVSSRYLWDPLKSFELPKLESNDSLQDDLIVVSEITGIEKKNNDAGEIRWLVHCSRGISYECEFLFCSLNIKKLYQFLNDKEKYSAQFHEYCQKARGTISLVVHFSSPVKITEQLETYFLPKSISQEKGYFIGEFEPFDENENVQKFKFMTLIDEEETSEEDISKTIKLLKRFIKKVFPLYVESRVSESIQVKNLTLFGTTCDKLFENVKNEFPQFYFIGGDSPLYKKFINGVGENIPREEIFGITRSLSALVQAKENFIATLDSSSSQGILS